MSFSTLLHWLGRGTQRGRGGRARQRSRRQPTRPRLAFRPRLDVLEDRTLPSVFLVTNPDDSGAGSLRAAITAANTNPGADRIVFAPTAYGTITLTSGQLDITDDLKIDGPGAAALAVSGNDTSRVFRIDSGVTADIDDLTVTHGRADNGGGIWNAGGSLSLTRVVVSQNQALGGADSRAQGGGVLNLGGTLTVTHSTFTDNLVQGGFRGQGGGITCDLDATTTVSDSTFSNNRAIGGAAAGATAGNGGGGGLWNGGGSALLVSHSTFTHNQAIGGAGGAGQVGGFGNGGGLNIQIATLASVDHSTFTDNEALGGPGGAGAEGGYAQGGGVINVS